MYQHHIQAMASSLVEAGLATDQKQVELVLQKYWEDKVAVVWTTEDVHAVQDDFNEEMGKSSLTDDQALEILLSVFENQDGNNGVTWESLRFGAKKYAINGHHR